MLVDRILRLSMRSVKREILDRILHAVCDLSKIDPICNHYRHDKLDQTRNTVQLVKYLIKVWHKLKK